MLDVDVPLGDDQPEGGKAGKAEKNRLVRDSFTIPKAEYTTLNELKQRATTLAQPTKKSELLRAGIALLKGLSDEAFKQALAAVPNLKTGRPPKEGEEGAEPAPRVGRKIIDKIDHTGGTGKAGPRAKPARKAARAGAAAGGAAKPARAAKANKPAKVGKAAKADKTPNPAKAAKLAARNKA